MCGITWFLFVSFSWLVELLISCPSHLWLYHLGYNPVYKDRLIHYFGPNIFGGSCILMIFMCINPVLSCWENVNLDFPCLYIHSFLLLSVGRSKITIQRRFWGSRTGIHELLNWFFFCPAKDSFGHAGALPECWICQECHESSFPIKSVLKLHPF